MTSRAPAWLKPLLCMAAEKLALSGVRSCVFKAHAGKDCDALYRASLCIDSVTCEATLYVHHEFTGRFVCRSMPAPLATSSKPDTPPDELQALRLAVVQIALRGGGQLASSCLVVAGSLGAGVAMLHFDLASSMVEIRMHCEATGRLLASSEPVIVDELDEDCWNTDLHNCLDGAALPESAHGLDARPEPVASTAVVDAFGGF